MKIHFKRKKCFASKPFNEDISKLKPSHVDLKPVESCLCTLQYQRTRGAESTFLAIWEAFPLY